MNFSDTIAAIATPMGEGGVGIIRISGEKALQIALELLRTPKNKTFKETINRKVYYGIVIHPETKLPVDEVLFFYAQKPNSYTAEDVVEIHSHGGVAIVSRILEIVLSRGVRLAEPGEFTIRAFLNGRIDLVQAESVIDLIRAKTIRSQEVAIAQLTGRTSTMVYEIEAELYKILVAIEAILDYPEEGLPEIQRTSLLFQIDEIENRLKILAAGVDEGRKIREGVNIVIVGRPNVGKSSLLNAIIQEEKAIVTNIPGTTRDVIEAQIQLRGIPFILTDTAGLRETNNIIEKMGIEKAEKLMSSADLIMLILDGSQALTDDDCFIIEKISSQKFLIVINKTDLPMKINLDKIKHNVPLAITKVSSVNRRGFDELESNIIDLVGLGSIQIDDRPLLSRVRHKEAIEKARIALKNFKQNLKFGLSEDLLAVDLRSCLGALGEITGKDVSSEVLHQIFSTFCIGK